MHHLCFARRRRVAAVFAGATIGFGCCGCRCKTVARFVVVLSQRCSATRPPIFTRVGGAYSTMQALLCEWPSPGASRFTRRRTGISPGSRPETYQGRVLPAPSESSASHPIKISASLAVCLRDALRAAAAAQPAGRATSNNKPDAARRPTTAAHRPVKGQP